MRHITIEPEAISEFKNFASCPNNVFPESLDHIQLVVSDNDNLIDYELFDQNDISLYIPGWYDNNRCHPASWCDWDGINGYALAVLFGHARVYATKNPVMPSTIESGWTFASFPESIFGDAK